MINSVDKQELWSVLSELRGKSSKTPLPMSDLYNHFKVVLNTPQKEIPKNNLDLLNERISEFLKEPLSSSSSLTMGGYTTEFLIKVAKSLKGNKSAFLDGTLNEVIKHSINSTAQVFCKLFNLIETSAEFPTS